MNNKLLEALGITPGPWKVSKSGNPHFALCVVAPDGGSVCHITQWITTQEGCAKAISKVPELISALLKIHDAQHKPNGTLLELNGAINSSRQLFEEISCKTWEEIKELIDG